MQKAIVTIKFPDTTTHSTAVPSLEENTFLSSVRCNSRDNIFPFMVLHLDC